MAVPVQEYRAPAGIPYLDGPSYTHRVTKGGERFTLYDDGDVVESVMLDGVEVETRWPQEIDLTQCEALESV